VFLACRHRNCASLRERPGKTDLGMKPSQGTLIAPTDTHESGPDGVMGHASRFWPSPLRRREPDPDLTGVRLPKTLLGFVWRLSAWDQGWIAALSVGVSFLGTAPIEIQRRMVNEALKQRDLHAIAVLAAIYAGLVLAQGIVKLALNMYRSWVSANSIRVLRTSISTLVDNAVDGDSAGRDALATRQGVKVSMIVAESDAIGGFVGDFFSEPVLQISILVTVFGYMVFLQPFLAGVSLLIFAPQLVFVPLMQQAINRRVRARIAKLREAGADVIADQEEANVEALGHEGRFREVFRLDMGIFTLKFTLNFLMNVTTHMGTVAILGLGAWLVIAGQTQVGTVVAFLSGLANVTDPWGDLVNWFQNLMVTSAKYGLVHDAVTGLATGGALQQREGGVAAEEAAARASRVHDDTTPAAPETAAE
jgi:ABC-type multidrug transport system fused ATPase/permease subunit